MSAILQESCLNIGKISHRGSVHTTEISKGYKSGLLSFPLPERQLWGSHETRDLPFIPPCGFVPWWAPL